MYEGTKNSCKVSLFTATLIKIHVLLVVIPCH